MKSKLLRLQASVESNANSNFLKAEKILLQSIKSTERNNHYVSNSQYSKLYLGELYTKMYKFDEAESLFLEIEQKYCNTSHHILNLLYYYMGQFYQQKKENNLAILYFEKSLYWFNLQHKHIDLKVKILESLSTLYYQSGNYKKSHDFLSESKLMNEALFGSRSEQNKQLFEIRDEYGNKIQEQKLILLQKEKDILLLKSVIYVTSLVLLILLILIYFIRKRKKDSNEQNILKAKQALLLKNREEVLELKNKELLSSAMQLIERDGMLNDIKKQLKTLEFNKENEPFIKNILQSLKINRSQKWKEFHANFTALNHTYFASLKNRFPALTKTDLKICAFINLGFSSKDMAQIMGLGVDSVNTSRSRLRKKMDLNRDVILVDFLQIFNEEDKDHADN